MMTKWKMMMLGLLPVALVGCSASKAPDVPATPEKKEPVEISVAVPGDNYLTAEEFARYIQEPIKNKYPYITVKMIKQGQGNQLENWAASKTIPDILLVPTFDMNKLYQYGISYDMEAMAKQYNIDLNRFENDALQYIRANSPKNELNAIPYSMNTAALYYNKDLFDRYAVSYPTDGMTWDQVYEVAKRFNRTDDGVFISGLKPHLFTMSASQLSLDFVDRATGKAKIVTDPWKNFFDQINRFYLLPGNEAIVANAGATNMFMKDRSLAMLTFTNFISQLGEVKDLNWDMVTLPTWSQAPGMGLQYEAQAMAITSTSKYKEEAFRVIEVMTSDEVQMAISKLGRAPGVKGQTFIDAFGSNLKFNNPVNLKAFFGTKPAKPGYTGENLGVVRDAMVAAQKEMINGKDIYTALREAEEKANQQLDKAPSK
ncbi:ABC transporter substrate-binding protein [Paenibacillus oceani]|uniref:Extracellular solute-binding protein n=1 Tax=Paenibacillus oceani TaxID=2772510 RepID=A0A927C6K9_9BACL|nr:extracellular solute-binding protein [Paenibacillus oceani]MBD2862319.1 extracellular solute-binding protein [Paenibacillus oceani]